MNRFVCILGYFGVCSAAAVAAPLAYRVDRLGPTDEVYAFAHTEGAIRHDAIVQARAMNALGQSLRYGIEGAYLGQDAWLQQLTLAPSSAVVLGFSGSGYEFATGAGVYRVSVAIDVNATGQAIGATDRYNATGQYLGRDAWLQSDISPTRIGLSGDAYAYDIADGTTFRASEVVAINSAGQAVGISLRFNPFGEFRGIDAYLSTNASTTILGLIGSGYETSGGVVERMNFVHALNDAGDTIGTASRFGTVGTPLGEDAWLQRSGTPAVAIGLDGAGYSYTSGGGTVRSSSSTSINAAGLVIGTSARFNAAGVSLGRDAWLRTGPITLPVGLIGSDYDHHTDEGTIRHAVSTALNDAGYVVGTIRRVDAEGDDAGQDIWLRRPDGTTTVVNPISERFSARHGDVIYRHADLRSLNAVGSVIGIATTFDSSGTQNGQAGWYFDASTHVTTPLAFSGSAASYGFTDPRVLTDEGVVFGTYARYDGETRIGDSVFRWSMADGFIDLGDFVVDSLDDAGWKAISSLTFEAGAGHPFLIGSGMQADQLAGSTAYRLVQLSPGDANADGIVGFDDLLALAQHYGSPTAARWSTGDFDRDGAVSFDDLLLLAQHYGIGEAVFADDLALAFSLVPEPATLTLLSLGFAAGARRRNA